METIGIIAGNGVFPIQILEKAKQKKYRVVVAGILQEASPALKDKSDAFEWIKIGQLKKLKDFFTVKEDGFYLPSRVMAAWNRSSPSFCVRTRFKASGRARPPTSVQAFSTEVATDC